MTEATAEFATKKIAHSTEALPRLGFAGVGWIGRSRLEALAQSGLVEIDAITDPDAGCLDACRDLAPKAETADSFEALLERDLDAIVIATPSALHAEQSIAAFEKGLPVFCQKPLGRNRAEVERVVSAACRADRLLGVDLSYRWTQAASAVRDLVQSDCIGRVFHLDLIFNNAYGPDKPWFYDLRQSGGGCVIDLGVHLVDMALWVLGFPQVTETQSRLYSKGALLPPDHEAVEDFASAHLITDNDASITLTCSWNLHAGCEAEIAARFYGDRGAALFENVHGSFYDFLARHCTGTQAKTLVEPPDEWFGRAAVQWAHRLRQSPRFDPRAVEHIAVAKVLDDIYGR